MIIQLRRRLQHATGMLEQLLYTLSTYGLPVVIVLFTFGALFVWDNYYAPGKATPVEFRVLKEGGTPLALEHASEALNSAPLLPYLDTNRSESPYWFIFVAPSNDSGETVVVEFPSRHATQIACWNAQTLDGLGSGTRHGTEGRMAAVKAGFALMLPPVGEAMDVLCKAGFVGPARLSINDWTEAELQGSVAEFHRKSGLLDGGLLVLALFMLVTAVIMRQSRYLLFAVWLVVNVRVGALSAGWDMQWLGNTIPPDWMPRIRSISMATYCVALITLFASMFKDDYQKIGHSVLLRALQWSCLPLLILSASLPYKSFLPFLWIASSATVVALVFLLSQLVVKTRSRSAMWYSASLAITLLANLSEVLAAAFDLRALTTAVNSVTAALSSSLLAALALAEQMRQEHQQRLDVQAELEHTYEAMPIGLFTLDISGQFMSVNPALIGMLGTNVLEAGQSGWEQHFNKGSLSQLINLVHSEPEAELEVHNNEIDSADGPKRFLVKATLARGKIEGSLQDITDKAKAFEELQYMAENDPLTKVYNRRGIERMFENAMAGLQAGEPLAVAYLDLDRFKLINGLYGHTAGDDVLRQVCQRVTSLLSGAQQIGRVGGDEFIIVFPNSGLDAAAWICSGIVASVSTAPYRIGDKAFQVGASVGLIEVQPGARMKDVLATADRACREAKKTGTGVVVYDKSSSAFREREAEFHIVERLAAQGVPLGLFLEMQPIMSLTSPTAFLNFEVLLRMREEDGSVVPAGRIIGAAEHSGRTSVIDRWVMSTTLDWITTHLERLTTTRFVCMNLSGASLNDERFVQDAFAMLAANPAAAGRLCIEITESVALHDLGNTRRFIEKVRSYGVKVALDDFGAGYTSFSYLKELPADVLKIDGSFIVNMNSHPSNIAIVEAIVSLARSLGMQTIAEWAEDSSTVETLAEIGVDHVQGFAVSRPQSPEKILAASSSAGFIQDAKLNQLVRNLDHAQLSFMPSESSGLAGKVTLN